MDNVLNEFLFDLYLIGQDIVKKPPDKDDMSFFPFICKLDDIKEVDNKKNWEKSNPMFHRPMSD